MCHSVNFLKSEQGDYTGFDYKCHATEIHVQHLDCPQPNHAFGSCFHMVSEKVPTWPLFCGLHITIVYWGQVLYCHPVGTGLSAMIRWATILIMAFPVFSPRALWLAGCPPARLPGCHLASEGNPHQAREQ